MKTKTDDYLTGLELRMSPHAGGVDAAVWDALVAERGTALSGDAEVPPFMRHAFLQGLEATGCATPETGWTPHWLTLHDGEDLVAACVVYEKGHSYGEYVFDWAWAQAHHDHGIAYYPKGLVAVPFTPVPGPRLLWRTPAHRDALMAALLRLARDKHWSSLHVLLTHPDDVQALVALGFMARQTVQFHWHNRAVGPYADWADFLGTLQQVKRKKIKQEQRKVADAGVTWTALRGDQADEADWALLWQCYERTYLEHRNAPYLTPAFFEHLRAQMAGHWVLFVARNAQGQRIACSLVGIDHPDRPRVAYGRYWGALARVDALHFDACYYQPLQWCIAHGVQRFEGGAQGEHKMARALMPVAVPSAHWVRHPAFADAIDRYLTRETAGTTHYLDELGAHSPFKQEAVPSTRAA